MAKITGILMILSNWGHLAIYFDNTLEEYKLEYLITSERMTLTVFSSFFVSKLFKNI